MRNRRKGGFTLVEIVVAMGLMSTAMVMILTMSILMFNFSGQENGFTKLMNELSDARGLVTSFVSAHDTQGASACLVSGLYASDGSEMRFLSVPEVISASACERVIPDQSDTGPVQQDAEPALEPAPEQTEVVYLLNNAAFFLHETYNTVYCAMEWDGDACNFDALSWVNSGGTDSAAAAAERAMTDWLYDRFAAVDGIVCSVDESGALCITAETDGAETALSVFWDEIEQRFAYTEQSDDAQPGALQTKTVCSAPSLLDAVFRTEDGRVYCDIAYSTGYQSIRSAFCVSHPPAVMKARCAVLEWVAEAVEANMTSFATVTDALQIASDDGCDVLCFLPWKSCGDYNENARRIYWHTEGENRMDATDRAGTDTEMIIGARFEIADSGSVRCSLEHLKKGKNCDYTFLAARHTSVVSGEESE